VSQASGRIIHGNLRPKDNDEGVNKDWITKSILNIGVRTRLRMSH